MKKVVAVNISLVAFLFVGCGGGGGGGNSSALTPTGNQNNNTFSSVAPADIVLKPSKVESIEKYFTQNYTDDENFIRNIAIIDSDFYNIKEYKDRLTEKRYNNQNWEAEITSHGTLVAAVIAKNNENSKLYAIRSAASGSKLSALYITSDMYIDALNWGAKIFNHSYGGKIDPLYDSETGLIYPGTEYVYSNYPIADETIQVWAAGNDGYSHATRESLYPDLNHKFKNSFVAVAAVDSKNNTLSLAKYSNRIGEVAKTWGIAALGTQTIYVTGKDGVKKGVYATGTSFAAPAVTAAVANIWSKYPWMDNHLVLVSLFSTANARGSNAVTTGPDNEFGWGVLNESRALNGPARFDTRLLTDRDYTDSEGNRYLKVNLSYRNYLDKSKLTWSNDIKGDAGIYKDGTGTLYLSGKNNYQGKTIINNGVLAFLNSLTTKQVKINSAGTLLAENRSSMVNITSSDDFINDGSLDIYGKGLIINSNYKSGANSRIVIDIKDSLLDIKGNMDLQGSRIVADIKEIDRVPKNTTNARTIIKATTISNYSGDYAISKNINPYISILDLKQNSNNINVNYYRNTTNYVLNTASISSSARSHTSLNLDRAFDTLALNNSSNPKALILLNATPMQLGGMIDTLSGQIHSQTQEILYYQNSLFGYQLDHRLSNLILSQNSGVYSDLLHSKFKAGGKNGFAKADTKNKTGYLGYDFNIDNMGFGVALNQGNSSIKFNQKAGDNKINYLGFSAYGVYDFYDFYLGLKASYTKSTSKIERELIDEIARSRYSTHIYDMGFRVGYIKDLSTFKISPFFGANYSYMSRNSFNEDIDFGISSPSKRYHKGSILFGVDTIYNLGKFGIKANLTQKYLLKNGDYGFLARYSGIDSSTYIKGDKEAKYLNFASMQTLYNVTKNLNLNLSYSLGMRDFKDPSSAVKLGFSYKLTK